MVTADFRPEVEIWLFCACAMHPAIIIGTVLSLWNWLWGRYHVPQNVFLILAYDHFWQLFSRFPGLAGSSTNICKLFNYIIG